MTDTETKIRALADAVEAMADCVTTQNIDAWKHCCRALDALEQAAITALMGDASGAEEPAGS